MRTDSLKGYSVAQFIRDLLFLAGQSRLPLFLGAVFTTVAFIASISGAQSLQNICAAVALLSLSLTTLKP